MYMYVGLAVSTILFVPLQYLFMNIFKAYYEELKEGGLEYSQVPSDDEDSAWVIQAIQITGSILR